MPISQTHLLKEVALGHDGPPIPESKRIYFQERLRNRFFDFLLSTFDQEQKLGLNQAKLARRIGRSAEVVNRWLSAPNNLTIDSISDMLLGMGGYELDMSKSLLLNRSPTNHRHLDDIAEFRASGGEKEIDSAPPASTPTSGSRRLAA